MTLGALRLQSPFAHYRIGFYLTLLNNSLTTTRSEESVHKSWVLLSIGPVMPNVGLAKLDLYKGSGLKLFLRTMREYFSRRIIKAHGASLTKP